MTEQSPDEALFFAALEKGTPEERAAYLDAACKDDLNLRYRIEGLLKAYPKAANFLEPPARAAEEATGAVEEATGAYFPTLQQSEKVIAGRYKLLEKIGEGGMGEVWVADQLETIKRRVALKLIKPGMDSKTVLSRFEAERQALAMMDHPNIAKVFDGGTTENGRPFFVMEYVKGVAFTKYCDDARLNIADRLALFVAVCQAVQHAHQKGIIHRDLKPSNILICLYDGKPVPKVIDFGLAKAMHKPLTEQTLFTGHGVMMGTPLYMSPEQAELNNLDLDTRTDIYALGVILYELLTGSTPLEKQRFKQAAWHEMLRLIKEEEPPRPSIRLSGSGALPSLAAQRQLEPVKLTRLVRGELDWIVMKCLEKERSRRYETANGLGRDVERYLADDVVEARPTTAGYRLRKFVRRNKGRVIGAGAFAALLIAAAGISAILAMKATRAEAFAEDKRVEAETNATKAERVSDQLWKSIGENIEARRKTELQAAGLQIDLALQEIRQKNQAVGLLQLARFLNKSPTVVEYPFDDKWASGKTTTLVDAGPEFDKLREFATMAVLVTGQKFKSLLPQFTDDALLQEKTFFNSKGDRLIARAANKTVRLLDSFTGRQIAILRRANEKVFEVGFSPDGSTAYTHSLDGVVRLWETKDGAFRAETVPRPERLKFVKFDEADPFEDFVWWFGFDRVTELSNDRLLTSREVREKVPNNKTKTTYPGPVELWDAKTGRLITCLDTPKTGLHSCFFFGDGRWIGAHATVDGEYALYVFSVENGRPMAKLSLDKEYSVEEYAPTTSPSGHFIAMSSTKQNTHYVHCWDTTTWKLSSTTGPFDSKGSTLFYDLIADDLLSIANNHNFEQARMVCRSGLIKPITLLPGEPNRFQDERVVLESGQLYETQTWRRLQPSKGRRYHTELVKFAPDGRFVDLKGPSVQCVLIDTATEKTLELLDLTDSFYQPGLGWLMTFGNRTGFLRLPPPNHLKIPPEVLELWAQVTVGGQLDEEGVFVKWAEQTWEKKRRELASKPIPYPDFPFPGQVAVDRLH